MVGSKCRDFKNCEVSNVNAPTVKPSIFNGNLPLKESQAHSEILDFGLLWSNMAIMLLLNGEFYGAESR